MRKIELKQTSLDTCINDAQHERVIITRDGKPVVLVIGVEGMDEEQLQLVLSGGNVNLKLLAEPLQCANV
jgi:antitoxin (DNA-binding transcriptional repressor) of toxin-antitoxin stability system